MPPRHPAILRLHRLLLAIALAIVVFYGAVISDEMIKQANQVTAAINRQTELW